LAGHWAGSQALDSRRTGGTDLFRRVDLAQPWPGLADREEQVRIDVAASSSVTPAHFGTPPAQGLPPIRLIISSMAMWYRSVNSETCSKETGSGNSLAALSAACG
jgi:hypothetical protein